MSFPSVPLGGVLECKGRRTVIGQIFKVFRGGTRTGPGMGGGMGNGARINRFRRDK